MDLLYIWRDYRYWSKFYSALSSPSANDLEGKVTDLEIYVKICVKVFKISQFLNPCIDLPFYIYIYIILFSNSNKYIYKALVIIHIHIVYDLLNTTKYPS